VTVW